MTCPLARLKESLDRGENMVLTPSELSPLVLGILIQ
jgi:hypothetical protein